MSGSSAFATAHEIVIKALRGNVTLNGAIVQVKDNRKQNLQAPYIIVRGVTEIEDNSHDRFGSDVTMGVTMVTKGRASAGNTSGPGIDTGYQYMDMNNGVSQIRQLLDVHHWPDFYALVGDGGDHVRVPAFDPTGNSGAAFSLGLWVNEVVFSGGTLISQWDKGDLNAQSWLLSSRVDGTGELELGGSGGRFKLYLTSEVFLDGTWHHFAFTWGDSTLKIYIDGAEDTSVTKSVDDAGTLDEPGSDIILLARNKVATVDKEFTGAITSIHLFDSTLSATDVALLRVATAVTPAAIAPPTASWLATPGSGTTVTDATGNGNTGTFGSGGAAPSWGGPYYNMSTIDTLGPSADVTLLGTSRSTELISHTPIEEPDGETLTGNLLYRVRIDNL